MWRSHLNNLWQILCESFSSSQSHLFWDLTLALEHQLLIFDCWKRNSNTTCAQSLRRSANGYHLARFFRQTK